MLDISLGSHLITPCKGYNHHGIYVGNHQVIHLSSNSQVEMVSLNDFTEGQRYDIHPFYSKFSRQEIIDRATSRLGNDDYNVIFNNCEHFCHWCIHDKPYSKQVRNVTLAGITAHRLISSNSLTPVIPAAIVGFGVFKLVQWLSD